jgi:hypothetical protein
MLKKLIRHKELIIDILVLVLISFFLLSFFQPKLLLLQTTINGGDTGSHFPCAAHLKEILLPQAKIMGWMQGNYAGYPLFYHYFPLPFLLAAFLSYLISLEVSFKLITVLGTFLLPVCAYFAFRVLKYEFPIPIFAAIFTLPFLFNQGNSMWGGNIPSTLAGEFCYSLGFAFVLLFLGTLYRGVAEKRYLILNAVLIFLIGFSHAYTLIFCLILGSFFAFDNFKKNLTYLLGVYGLGFLFLAFWLLPVLGNLPYTTSFVFRWTLHSIFEVFPIIIIPFAFLSLFAVFINRKDKRAFYFIYAIFACVFIYLIGPRIGVLDIRFVPFFQILLVLLAATAFRPLVKNLKLTFILPIILFFLVAMWVDFNTTYIQSWIDWNYNGYENKKTWNVFRGINEYLKHAGKGRVEWEHTPLDEALGSIRSSETLPYFARRQTLEGIHMLGSLTAPFVFYIESETSYQSCNPIPDYFYSTLDLKRGIDHFKMFNVSHFVVRTPELKKVVKNYPELRLVKVVGQYHIYRLLRHPEEYVVPLVNRPVLFLTSDWRDVSYQWFTKEKYNHTFLVFAKQAGEKERGLFGKAVSELEDVKSVPYLGRDIQVKSIIKEESIEIETSRIGHPLLVKVSYHPNWRVEGAEKIYFASPSFMLVFPTQHKVRLTFEPGLPSKVGGILTLLGIILAGLSPFWFKKYMDIWQMPESEAKNKNWIILVAMAVTLVLAFLLFNFMMPEAAAILKKGRADFDRGSYALAREKFYKAMQISKLSSQVRCEAGIYYASCFVRENRFEEGAKELRAFINNYPNSYWTPQAYFDLAHCEINLGNWRSASRIYRKIIKGFSATTWAKYSKERLREHKGKF